MTDNEQAECDLPFLQLARNLPTPCWISDAEGAIIWVNEAWLEYTGKDPQTLRREGLAVLHDPQVLPRVQEKWARTRAVGQPDEMVFPLRGRDGSLRPFLTRVAPLRDERGSITRWFGTNTDVSREAEAEVRAARWEAEVRDNETRLRLATDAAGVGIWEWRLDTNEMIYSKRAREICGFDADVPVTYEMVAAVTHPDDFPWTSAQAARALDPLLRDHSPYEYRIVRPSGEMRWVTACGEAVFEPAESGRPKATRYVGTLIDITERKLADEAIRASERRLQMALRAGRMAAWRVDGNGTIATSPELNALIGLPAEARPTLADLAANYLPGELERISTAIEAARNRGERHFEIEYRYRRADGEVRWFNMRAEALVNADGAPDGAIGIAVDITQRKSDEERLQFLAREVDHRANNLMAVIESVVALSSGDSTAELRSVLRGRVHALAKAHRLLADARWVGAELGALVREELLPYGLGSARTRLQVSGPEAVLSPASAQAVAMVIHELATNAAKHGALSTESGSVKVAWYVDSDHALRLSWTETGGPAARAPEHRGLGLSVILRTFSGHLGGAARLDWRPEGLAAEFVLPDSAGSRGPKAQILTSAP